MEQLRNVNRKPNKTLAKNKPGVLVKKKIKLVGTKFTGMLTKRVR
jgi:hypothetical protein